MDLIHYNDRQLLSEMIGALRADVNPQPVVPLQAPSD
jgi:hypothetical protein